MTSAVNPWDTESQPSVAHCPPRHNCLILFGRMVVPPVSFVDSTNGLRTIKPKPSPEARATPTQLQASGATLTPPLHKRLGGRRKLRLTGLRTTAPDPERETLRDPG